MKTSSQEYDEVISEHYRHEAENHGLNPTSTMLDRMIREKETLAILAFVEESIETFDDFGLDRTMCIMDVGCGNGYTLERLSEAFPSQQFFGVEKTKELFQLASSRFNDKYNVKILNADIRDENFFDENSVDIIVSQRVLINILNEDDQKAALNNIVKVLANRDNLHQGGRLISIESFKDPLNKLNLARQELDLPPLNPQYHNLYLNSNFFDIPSLFKLTTTNPIMAPNFLSTNYFIARVLYPLLKKDQSISRNSELVNFFVHALKDNIGDYAPLKVHTFSKVT